MFQSPSATAEKPQLRAEAGTPLAPLLREAGLLTLPCGVGKCGKCLILAATEPCAEERALLGDAALASGLRLACYTRAAEGLDIALPQAGALRVLTRFAQSDYPFRPIVERRPFAMPEPSLDDQRSDLQRLIDACGAKGHALGLGQLTALPAFIRNARSNGGCGDGHGNVCGFGLMHGETLVGYTASDEAYALIVDIGTTTLAARLYDRSGTLLAQAAAPNPQRVYGADVISRIEKSLAGARTSSAASATKRNGKNTATARTRCNRPSPSRFPQCSPGCWNRPGSATWTSCP